ncbi:hypothetical protein DUI87_12568 [Hirundo rustica rustica]|uniref:Major facilitator superfamily (MFS) profile domain-containing protein n=1 Tax=Hirundo rustica rustica TaxID=333673 RepID=A0A3M0KCB5_HIRRU|nr:hypothetical protein DUI87_12568 [Hirundo rustica rustica]
MSLKGNLGLGLDLQQKPSEKGLLKDDCKSEDRHCRGKELKIKIVYPKELIPPSQHKSQITLGDRFCSVESSRWIHAVNVICSHSSASWQTRKADGILLDIQKYFGLSDGRTGLLQTVFTLCYMLAAPIFGYLGDRYNRKIILGAGIFFWSAVTLGSSFITESHYAIFILSRGLVGIGSASYSTIAPTILADLFEEGKRTRVLSVFYIFIPVGSGCGYMLAAGVAKSTGDWHWAFRVTPCMGGLALLLLILLLPHRIQRKTAAHRALSISGTIKEADEKSDVHRTAKTTWCQDVGSLVKK